VIEAGRGASWNIIKKMIRRKIIIAKRLVCSLAIREVDPDDARETVETCWIKTLNTMFYLVVLVDRIIKKNSFQLSWFIVYINFVETKAHCE
jgi:hypothetical protein